MECRIHLISQLDIYFQRSWATISEEKEFRRWLSMYFYHTSNVKINFLDNKKDIHTNIQNIKKKLGI